MHLAGGGLVSQPTLAIIGDSISSARGGAGREAVLPLDDSRAIDQITSEISRRMPQPENQRPTTTIEQHYHIKGNLLDHSALVQQVNRQVRKGAVRLSSSNSFRVTKKA